MLEPCCALKYYPEIEVGLKEVELEDTKLKEEEERENLENFGVSKIGRIRKFLWNLTEYPEKSKKAQVLMLIFLFFQKLLCQIFFPFRFLLTHHSP